ncbi:MAG: acyl-CoA dehydrogenase family protein [Planctomycetes bacterium]|nr:acyl-CoA dehydrogenase family protein [Planctomycetota bacterium]
MPFFTEEQETVLSLLFCREEDHPELVEFLSGSLASFAAERIAPRAAENDREEVFDVEAFRALGELGLMALPYPEAYGGMGASFAYYCAGLETLAKADAGFALAVGIHGTACDGIHRFAEDHLKARYLEDLVQGRKIAAFCLTEPGSGSDARNMKTTWRREGGEVVLKGTKYWITNGLSADVFFVLAAGSDGCISAFVVDRAGKGVFERAKIADKMGVRSSNTAELVFDDYRIPADRLVGEEGQGFRYAMEMLAGGRITIAAQATGIAQGAYEKILKYAHERELFGVILKDLDNTKRELSEMQIEIQASRHLAYSAAELRSRGKDVRGPAAIAKVKATEAAVRVAQRAIQLAGGYGYVQDSKIERALRDSLLHRIGEGANEALTILVIPRVLYSQYERTPLTEIW